MESSSVFRQKAKSQGLKLLGHSSLNEFCIGVLYDDKTPKKANPKKDMMWFRCNLASTAGSILKAYQSGVALAQKIVLRCNGTILESTDTVSKFNTSLDKVVVIEAVAQSTSTFSNHTSQRDPLHARSTNDVAINTEASMDQQTPTKHTLPSAGDIVHALPYQLPPSPEIDRLQLVNVMNLICKYEGTDKNALNEHLLTYGELMLLFTMIDFVHEKLAHLRDQQGATFTSFSESGFAAQEMIRFKNENAGFYAFYLSTKDKYIAHVKTYGSDKAFMMVHSDWRAMSHRKIAYWVRNGSSLQYTPVAMSTDPHQTQSIETAISSEDKITNSPEPKFPDSELSRANDPEVEPSEQFSLQTLFTDCTSELLEAGVEHGVKLLEHLKEPLRRVAPDLDAAEWLKSIENLQKQAEQPKTIVGVVGNTGAGKSSVINAMLDEERLVPTNCMRACTAVVTEISYNYEEIPYRAEIEFITENDWEKELHILFSDLLDSNGNVSREASNQDSEAGVAYAKIKAVYPKYTHEMLTKTTAEKLLKHPAVQKVLGGKKNIADSNPEAFYKHLQSYVDSKEKTTGVEKKPAKPSMEMEYWPLIKVVRIYVKAAALSTGAVIVDLPGVHDSNAARARVAEGYMKQCTGLWIVAPITRAVDDKAAKSLLGETFKRQLKMDGGFDSVTFICSKTDDISILEAQESLGLEQEMGGLWAKSDEYSSEKRKLKKRLDELKQIKEEYTAVVDEIDEQIEIWEALNDDIDDGKTVHAPRDKSSSKKRKRGSKSNAAGASPKRQRSSDSDLDSDYVEDEYEGEPDSEEDESEA
uniref:Nuclear GTPase SLIP-GC n=1 Tax=Talaromyces marneffei PM1 TaxID=1077442 RepID=A0A093UP25_TALMA